MDKETHHAKIDMTVASILEWTQACAVQDLPTNAKSLFMLLNEMNDKAMPYHERYQLLCALKLTHNHIVQALYQLYADKEILSSNERKIANLVNGLNTALLRAYKRVITDGVRVFFKNKNIIMGSFSQALNLCSKVLHHCYEKNRSVFPGIWYELNALYAIAKENKLLKLSFEKYTDAASRLDTIERLYKYNLLMALSNPLSLQKNQLDSLMYVFEFWANDITLQEKPDKSTVFCIDFSQDEGPKHVIAPPPHAHTLWYLDLTSLNAHLTSLLETIAAKQESKAFTPSEFALHPGLIQKLLTHWETVVERSHVRKAAQGEVQVYLGITQIQSALTTVKPTVNTSVIEQSEEVIDLGSIPVPIVDSHETIIRAHVCELVDISRGGFCIKWTDKAPRALQCCELVGLLLPTENRWQVGTIKWMRSDEQDATLLGIKTLGAQVYATRIHRSDVESQTCGALLVVDEQNVTRYTLITPALLFKEGQDIVLDLDTHEYQAKLMKNYSQTNLYHEFSFDLGGAELILPSLAQSRIAS